MIKLNLEILDPNTGDAAQLRALAAMFLVLADGNKAGQAQVVDTPRVAKATVMPPVLDKLDPADNPAVGMPSPREAFAGHGSPELDADAAKLEALAGPGAAGPTLQDVPALPSPAAAFGGAGNVPVPGAGSPAISAPSAASLPPAPSSVPSVAGAPAAAGVELDVEGIPWDASIHASTKAKLASGAWKVKRGTPELYLKERKELLKAAVSTGGNVGVPATPPASASVPPPAGAGAPIAPPPASNGAVTMAQVLPRVTSAIAGGLLTPDSAAAIVRELSEGKIDNVAMLAVAPHLLAPFSARLDLLGIPA